MPSAESSERKGTKANQVGAPPSEPEQLQCPRCESTNTKFCYYNNYNFSQPRHFCKACRRYWTHGGTLRDIPVGGGSRKNAKRSRTLAAFSATSSSSPSSAANSTYEYRHTQATTSQLLAPLAAEHGGSLPLVSTEAKPGVSSVCGSFTSLLNTHGPAFFTLGGFGLGLGTGVEEIGFGLGRSVWPFPGIAVADGSVAGAGEPSVLGNTWQLQSGEAGIVGGGNCFSLSDVAISTTGHAFK